MSYNINKLIDVATAEVGYLEKKTNSNLDSKTGNAGVNNYNKYARDFDTKYPTFYNGKKNGYEWCDIFVDWCFVSAYGVTTALKLLCQPTKSCGAGCSWSASYYKKNNRFYTSPKVGDQIFFRGSDGTPCHTGIVYKTDVSYVYTVEGNTSSASGVVSNGGAVAKKKYGRNSSYIYGYGRPKYGAQTATVTVNHAKTKVNTIKKWQTAAITDGYKFPKYGADGSWGSECESVAKKAILKKQTIRYTNKNLVKFLQNNLGITADGKFGKDTLAAVKKFQTKSKLEVDGIVGLKTWKKLLDV